MYQQIQSDRDGGGDDAVHDVHRRERLHLAYREERGREETCSDKTRETRTTTVKHPSGEDHR